MEVLYIYEHDQTLGSELTVQLLHASKSEAAQDSVARHDSMQRDICPALLNISSRCAQLVLLQSYVGCLSCGGLVAECVLTDMEPAFRCIFLTYVGRCCVVQCCIVNTAKADE